ncbi:formylglycine-generating enzyme family protein [Halosquirtibacter xylanolyticus]|uniref:formylglycine-generating enzyme family protein n=1 Tax=Halosquirtibacter xylanolyticus TaxID=3374599 RepID=UPI00374A5BF3|nr:formylglycine-generating enzyme family protein [Prolixibacteraceae bacterium]
MEERRGKIVSLLLVLWVCLFHISCAQKSKPDSETDWIIKKSLTDLVYVKGGTFMLGDVGYTDSLGVHRLFANHGSALPVHKVTLDSYSIGKLEVTFKEFDLFCKLTGRDLVGEVQSRESGRFFRPELSATFMTWDDAMAYCAWLGKLTGLSFNLATNAQWEYAARSRGLAVKYGTDNGLMEKGRNYKSDYYETSADNPPPGSYPPNPLGLYDMSGINPEWVRDGYAPYFKWDKENPINDFQHSIVTIRGFHPNVYSRGSRANYRTGAGAGIRFVVNSLTPVDVETVLDSLGLSMPSSKDIEKYMPKNWVAPGKYPL